MFTKEETEQQHKSVKNPKLDFENYDTQLAFGSCQQFKTCMTPKQHDIQNNKISLYMPTPRLLNTLDEFPGSSFKFPNKKITINTELDEGTNTKIVSNRPNNSKVVYQSRSQNLKTQISEAKFTIYDMFQESMYKKTESFVKATTAFSDLKTSEKLKNARIKNCVLPSNVNKKLITQNSEKHIDNKITRPFKPVIFNDSFAEKKVKPDQYNFDINLFSKALQNKEQTNVNSKQKFDMIIDTGETFKKKGSFGHLSAHNNSKNMLAKNLKKTVN